MFHKNKWEHNNFENGMANIIRRDICDLIDVLRTVQRNNNNIYFEMFENLIEQLDDIRIGILREDEYLLGIGNLINKCKNAVIQHEKYIKPFFIELPQKGEKSFSMKIASRQPTKELSPQKLI